MKTGLTRFTLLSLAALLFGLAPHASAQVSDTIQLHGFGGWAAGFTDNENRYGNIASEDGEWNNYYFALNVAAQPSDDVSIHAQAFWGEDLRGKHVDLDFAFAQYTVRPELKVRAGKVLSPFGLYTEIFDVGTLRPFYLLPQGMYQAPGLITKAYLGAGLTGTAQLGGDWEISYDLYGGEIQMQEFEIEVPRGFDPQTRQPILVHLKMQPIGRSVIGSQVSLAPPVVGLELGVSFINMEVFSSQDGGPRQQGTENPGRDNLVAGHVEYLSGGISLRSEVLHMTGNNQIDAGYVEAAYKLPVGVQFAAIYDWHENSTPSTVERTPEELIKHRSFGVALNYWLSTDFVVKLNYYRIEHNIFAQPHSPMTSVMQGTLATDTNAFIVGTQFSF